MISTPVRPRHFGARVVADSGGQAKWTSLGVAGRCLFELGGRERLHRICGIDAIGIRNAIPRAVSARQEVPDAS